MNGRVSSTVRWLAQAVSGLLLILLLGVHMVANHYVVKGGLRTYDEVTSYLSHPVVLIWEGLFLIIVTVHAMLGVRSVLYDLGPSPQAQRRINGLILIVGAGIILYGLWLLTVIT